jgi:hypothetical protein
VLYDSAGFITGQQAFGQSFDLTSAGTVTMTLTEIPWMDTIAGLNGFLTTSSGLLGPASMTSGTETVSVQPGELYAHWFGDANGSFGTGVYGLKITFAPTGATTVGLPKSLVLMLCGLGLLFGWQRRTDRSSAATPMLTSA